MRSRLGLDRARPALACIIGPRRAWTVEMISSEEMPCRYVPVVDRCECPGWRWIKGRTLTAHLYRLEPQASNLRSMSGAGAGTAVPISTSAS